MLGGSKIGGCPDLPEGFSWPNEDDDEDEPLAFLCQINLAELHPHDLNSSLPAVGMMWFFTIADGDRAYGYEIDDDTTAVFFNANPGPLTPHEIPEILTEDDEFEIPENRVVFGPSLLLSETNEEGRLGSKRFDYDIEKCLENAIVACGGRTGVLRLLGNAHFFREENSEFDPEKEELLLEVDGYTVASGAFGEGSFNWTIQKTELKNANLEAAFLTFEPGT